MRPLTDAELAALEAIGRHGTAKQAAFALGKSRRTLEQQLASARHRLGVGSTVEAIYRLREREA
jgi:DNA-binding CsgD family transcriptional regulator